MCGDPENRSYVPTPKLACHWIESGLSPPTPVSVRYLRFVWGFLSGPTCTLVALVSHDTVPVDVTRLGVLVPHTDSRVPTTGRPDPKGGSGTLRIRGRGRKSDV